jgi:hypothetical protein
MKGCKEENKGDASMRPLYLPLSLAGRGALIKYTT